MDFYNKSILSHKIPMVARDRHFNQSNLVDMQQRPPVVLEVGGPLNLRPFPSANFKVVNGLGRLTRNVLACNQRVLSNFDTARVAAQSCSVRMMDRLRLFLTELW